MKRWKDSMCASENVFFLNLFSVLKSHLKAEGGKRKEKLKMEAIVLMNTCLPMRMIFLPHTMILSSFFSVCGKFFFELFH